MQRLLLLGLNHTTAPLAVREALAFSAEQQRRAISQLRQRFGECEFVLVSTCNRVELYAGRAVHGHPRSTEMVAFLGEFHGVPVEQFRAHLYEKSDRAAVEHLFTVASSLDSMVLGETQILGQVRQAYDLATELGAAGPALHTLFQRAFAVGKQVMHATRLGDGRLSVASVAVDYARRIFDSFGDKTLLCVGAGKMVRLVLRHFTALHPGRLLITNRTLGNAESLAEEFSPGAAVPFDALPEHLTAADIVISSTGSSRPIIAREHVRQALRARRYRPMLFIDIAVPRDVEAQVAELEHAYLCNIDDLQQVVSQTQASRTEAIAAARAIVERHVEQYVAWHRARRLGPMIDELYRRSHAIAQEELARTLGKLPDVSPQEREHLEELTRRIVNKLLHDPVHTLRDSDGAHGSPAPYLHALAKLFNLPEPPTTPGDVDRADELGDAEV
jgi:glutamyl-tRNA reductase